MGGLCSKHSTLAGGHTVIESHDDASELRAPADIRSAAADAAERRMKAAQSRGAKGDPTQGPLAAHIKAANLEASNSGRGEPERLVWD